MTSFVAGDSMAASTCTREEQTEVVSERVCDQEEDENLRLFIKQDYLLREKCEVEQAREKDIDLKDYSDQNIDLSSGKTPFLKVILENEETMIIKKSSYCWLLDEGKGKISNDRLRRFYINTKRKAVSSLTNTKKKKEKTAESSTSESENDNKTIYDDSTDLENDAHDQNVPGLPVETEKYYAVSYDEGWFLGRVIEAEPSGSYRVKFLKQNLDHFVWPKTTDIQSVTKNFFFYGPLDLVGTGPFQVKRYDLNNIKKKYKEFKRGVK
ncbi:hypothetical protein FQR65_LT02093 [Abscondita terminalis]|nr:hypothetical protein FQR65_LT02093 [Abscondita terminalis]